MVQRKTVPVDEGCEIVLALEDMSDGTWAVVASVKHIEGNTERVVDLPVPAERFATPAQAEAHGIDMARAWLAENRPRAA